MEAELGIKRSGYTIILGDIIVPIGRCVFVAELPTLQLALFDTCYNGRDLTSWFSVEV